jgi:hypothetical protein
MPLWERQEIQEMLRSLSAWQVNPAHVSHADVSHADTPHTAAYPSTASELNLRKMALQEGSDRGRLHLELKVPSSLSKRATTGRSFGAWMASGRHDVAHHPQPSYGVLGPVKSDRWKQIIYRQHGDPWHSTFHFCGQYRKTFPPAEALKQPGINSDPRNSVRNALNDKIGLEPVSSWAFSIQAGGLHRTDDLTSANVADAISAMRFRAGRVFPAFAAILIPASVLSKKSARPSMSVRASSSPSI